MTTIDQHMKRSLQQCGSDDDDARRKRWIHRVCQLRIMLDDGETELNKEAACFCEVKRDSYCRYMTYSVLVTLMDTFPKLCIPDDLIDLI